MIQRILPILGFTTCSGILSTMRVSPFGEEWKLWPACLSNACKSVDWEALQSLSSVKEKHSRILSHWLLIWCCHIQSIKNNSLWSSCCNLMFANAALQIATEHVTCWLLRWFFDLPYFDFPDDDCDILLLPSSVFLNYIYIIRFFFFWCSQIVECYFVNVRPFVCVLLYILYFCIIHICIMSCPEFCFFCMLLCNTS